MLERGGWGGRGRSEKALSWREEPDVLSSY